MSKAWRARCLVVELLFAEKDVLGPGFGRETTLSAPAVTPYFRRDQSDGISPPDLTKNCSYAEHIVKARGKRSQYTSVSTNLTKIRIFGDTNYRLERDKTAADGHRLVEHAHLVAALRQQANEGEKEERLFAINAIRYATMRCEGLVVWAFNITGVARKDVITWAQGKVQAYFVKV